MVLSLALLSLVLLHDHVRQACAAVVNAAFDIGASIETALDGGLLGTPESVLPVTLEAPTSCIACPATTDLRWALAGRSL